MRPLRHTILCLLMLAAVGAAQERPRVQQTVRFGVVPLKTVHATISTASTARRISEGTDRRTGRSLLQPSRLARTTKVVTITD